MSDVLREDTTTNHIPQATIEEEEKCAICFESITPTDKAVPNCGHIFHMTCLFSWMNRCGQRKSCPICRSIMIKPDEKSFDDFSDVIVEEIDDDLSSDYLRRSPRTNPESDSESDSESYDGVSPNEYLRHFLVGVEIDWTTFAKAQKLMLTEQHNLTLINGCTICKSLQDSIQVLAGKNRLRCFIDSSNFDLSF